MLMEDGHACRRNAQHVSPMDSRAASICFTFEIQMDIGRSSANFLELYARCNKTIGIHVKIIADKSVLVMSM